MASSNTSPAAKFCACAYIAFLAGIFSWYADSTNAQAELQGTHLQNASSTGAGHTSLTTSTEILEKFALRMAGKI
jgi:hypothetical protein